VLPGAAFRSVTGKRRPIDRFFVPTEADSTGQICRSESPRPFRIASARGCARSMTVSLSKSTKTLSFNTTRLPTITVSTLLGLPAKTMFDTTLWIGAEWACLRSRSAKSASFPGSIEPSSCDRPLALAPASCRHFEVLLRSYG
jgi:hypothetical protein